MISGLIGAEDALASGAETSKAVMGGMASAIGFGVGAGKLMGKGVKTAIALPKKALNAGQQLGKDIKNMFKGKGNAVEDTTNDIANELGAGGSQTPDAGQAVGGGNGPSGGGGPSGGSGGGGGAPSSSASKDQPIGDKLYDKAGKLAHVAGNAMKDASSGVGVANAAKQGVKSTWSMTKTTGKATGAMGKATGKATASVAKSAARSFSYMDKRSSFGTNAGHFAAGVAKSIATGATALGTGIATAATAVGTGVATAATAVGSAARTAARGVGLVARMGGAVVKNFIAPAAKSVARGVGAVAGLTAHAVTGGESTKVSNAARAAFSTPEQRAARRDARNKRNARYDDETQQKLNKKYQQEYDALQAKYSGKNTEMSSFYRDLEALQTKYRNKGLKNIK